MSDSRSFRQLPSHVRKPSSPPTSPHRRAPSSPTRRRKFFEKSDEASGDRSIEDWIYLRDPHRSTSIMPRYPLPMRWTTTGLANLNGLLATDSRSTLRSEIKGLLRSHHVDDRGMRFAMASKPGYSSQSHVEICTLAIRAVHDDPAEEDEWSQARRAIRSLLQDKDIDAHVEICDIDQTYQPSLFPIPPEDEHIKAYESYRQRMVADVEATLQDSWTSMCLYKIGNHLADTEYAVVIMVSPFTVHDWEQLRRFLLDKYMRTAESSAAKNMNIHFIPGRTILNERSPGINQADTLPTSCPNMGCSIGVDGEWGGGTLGAYLSLNIRETKDKEGRIKENARQIRGFVTNSHVTAPIGTTHPLIIEEYHSNGVNWNETEALGPKRPLIKYPAEADFVATQEHIKGMIEEKTKEIAGIDEKINQYQMMEVHHRVKALQEGRPNYVNLLAMYQNQEQRLAPLPLKLGRAYWASGRALNEENGSIDFAFVKIQSKSNALWNHCANDNALPKLTARGFLNQLPKDHQNEFEDLENVTYTSPNNLVPEFGDIIPGQWYFKTGRTTGLTAGICHGTEAFCKMTDPEERKKRRYDANGKVSEYMDHGYTTEWIILMRNSNDAFATQVNMTMPGDSGCIFVDSEGRAAGLGFGGINGACGPMACEEAGWVDPTTGDVQAQREELVGAVYGANMGIVTPMPVLQKHLRLRINAELGFC